MLESGETTVVKFLFTTGLRRKECSVFDNLNNCNAIRISSVSLIDNEGNLKKYFKDKKDIEIR